MEPIWNWGNTIIVAIQAVHNPLLDGFFNAVTFLGEAEFFLLLFPLVIWSVNKSVGLRLIYLYLISQTVNTWAKLLVGHPRPFEWPSPAASPVVRLNFNASTNGPGLPSGHTQMSLTVWFYLADHFRRPWLWLLATVLFVLVSFSRVYLGVHFPTDLLGGVVLGLVILLLYIKYEDNFATRIATLPLWPQIGLAVIVPYALILINPHHDLVATCATLTGLSLGVIFDRYQVGFEARGSVLRRVLRYFVGIIILGILYAGLKLVIPSSGLWHIPLNSLRYVLCGFWVSGGALWLFQRVKLD